MEKTIYTYRHILEMSSKYVKYMKKKKVEYIIHFNWT